MPAPKRGYTRLETDRELLGRLREKSPGHPWQGTDLLEAAADKHGLQRRIVEGD